MLSIMPSLFLMGWATFQAVKASLGIDVLEDAIRRADRIVSYGYQPGDNIWSQQKQIIVTRDDEKLGGDIYWTSGLGKYRGRTFHLTRREILIVHALLHSHDDEEALEAERQNRVLRDIGVMRWQALTVFLDGIPEDRI